MYQLKENQLQETVKNDKTWRAHLHQAMNC